MENKIDTQKIIAGIEEIVGLNPGEIKGNEMLHQIGWDSMAVISFIALADSELNKTIHASDIKKCESLPQLLLLLEK